jgi:conjugal transfer pilus assembly protein TraW
MILATILMIEAKEWTAEDKGPQAEVLRDASPQDEGKAIANSPVIELGVYGETFPIEEKNLLEVIRTKLQGLSESGKLEGHHHVILKKAKEQLNRPYPVRGLSKTTTPKSFLHDPSITVPYDLKDHQNQVFHREGTKINPLDTHQMKCPLLFVDGDDSEQVFWAIQQYKAAEGSQKPKIILVQGAPFELTKKLDLPVYFDQSGVLVKKLGISQVPARVSQNDKVLLVEEISPQEKKNGEG